MSENSVCNVAPAAVYRTELTRGLMKQSFKMQAVYEQPLLDWTTW